MERSILEPEFLPFDGRRGASRSDPSIHRNPGREKELNIAYRFRIYPTEEQKILLGKTFGCCRFLYNQMLNDKIQEYKKSKTMLKNTPAMYKKTYSFLKEVDSRYLTYPPAELSGGYSGLPQGLEDGSGEYQSVA